MALGLTGAIIAIIIIIVVFLLLSLIIRELTELFKVKNHTMMNAVKISGVIMVLLILQYLVSSWQILSGIVLAIIIITLFYMIQLEYKTNLRKTLLIGLCTILGFGILMAIIAGIIVLFG
ncbi:MAG: hypothetical protein ACMXYG_03580 [Candidatus Woesearchaeota archaeon]